MKILKRSVTVALLLFVGATVGMLIAQEVSRLPAVGPDGGATGQPTVSIDAQAPESQEGSIEAPDGSEEASTPPNDVTDAIASQAAEAPADAQPAEAGQETPIASEGEEAGAQEPSCEVHAIYFHNTLRCRTCKLIEATAKTAIEDAFPDALADGRLRWSAIDMQKQRHFVEQYSLVKPTLILVRMVDGLPQDWVALDETWTHIRSEVRFTLYVTDATRKFLRGCP